MQLTLMLLFEDVSFHRIRVAGPFKTFEECDWEIGKLNIKWEKWRADNFPEVPVTDPIQFLEGSKVFAIDEETGKEYWKEEDGRWYNNDGQGYDKEWQEIAQRMAMNSIGPVYVIFDKNLKELARFYNCPTKESAQRTAEAEYGKDNILVHELN